jgi:hypothetical protein
VAFKIRGKFALSFCRALSTAPEQMPLLLNTVPRWCHTHDILMYAAKPNTMDILCKMEAIPGDFPPMPERIPGRLLGGLHKK